MKLTRTNYDEIKAAISRLDRIQSETGAKVTILTPTDEQIHQLVTEYHYLCSIPDAFDVPTNEHEKDLALEELTIWALVSGRHNEVSKLQGHKSDRTNKVCSAYEADEEAAIANDYTPWDHEEGGYSTYGL